MRTALEVRQSFHGTHLAVRHFRDGQVSVGSDVTWRWSFLGVNMGNVPAAFRHVLPWLPPIWSEVEPVQHADFQLAGDDLDHGITSLFQHVEGVWTADIPKGWSATLDGQPITGTVPITDTLTIQTGDVTFRARQVPAAMARPRSIPEPEPPLLASFAMTAGVGALVALIGFFAPSPPQTTVADIPERLTELRITLPEKVEPEKPKVANTTEKASGTKTAKPDIAKSPKRSKDEQVARNAGIFSGGDLMGFDTVGISSDIRSAVGDLMVSQSGKGLALGGLNGRGDTLGGGGDGDSIGDVGDLFGKPSGGDRLGYDGGGGTKSEGTIATTSPPLIIGNIDPALIDAVIKRNLSQIRYCYRRELQRNPDIGGKTVFKFVIAKDGSVSSANLKSSSLNHPGVEQCIVGRLQRMSFPAPSGGGIAIVSYPFLFSPG